MSLIAFRPKVQVTMRNSSMRLMFRGHSCLFPSVAGAQSIEWKKYVVPETGALMLICQFQYSAKMQGSPEAAMAAAS